MTAVEPEPTSSITLRSVLPPFAGAVGARRGRTRVAAGGLLVNAFLLITSALMFFPFVWLILGSLKPAEELARPAPTFLPEAPSLDNFTRLFTLLPFQTFFANSLLVTIVTVALVLFTSSLLGYIFTRPNIPGATFAFMLIVSSMVMPFEVRVVPMFLIVQSFGWVDTYQSLIVPFAIDGFGVYLFREFIKGIPNDYFDAARMDGASDWTIYRSIILPLTMPVMSALAIFSFVYYWDQLIWPVVAIGTESMKTLPLGIALLSTERGARYDLALAAGTLAVLPPLIVFLIFQKRIVRGVVLAGLKG